MQDSTRSRRSRSEAVREEQRERSFSAIGIMKTYFSGSYVGHDETVG